MPEFRASFPAGNVDKDESPLPLQPQRLENNEHFFLLREARDKSSGNKLRCRLHR